MRPKIFAYYFPDYHVDPRNEAWFGAGWTEWDLVRSAQPRFAGHQQPRVPLLGYQDESDPDIAAQYIDLASRHGIDGFLFDYYWYDDGPYLETALENGFLAAANSEELEFSLMWANHDLVDMFPLHDERKPWRLLKPGGIDRDAFERFANHTIENYFSRPNHIRVDGRPRFTIYDIGRFITGMGGVAEAADTLRWFSARSRAAGYGGVHLDAVMWGFSVLPSEVPQHDPAELIKALGIDSASSYVWVHHADLGSAAGRMQSWESVAEAAFAAYEKYSAEVPVPFHPNVTVGWDATPRLGADVEYEGSSYPGGPLWTPSVDAFKGGLRSAKSFVERHPLPYREVTINAWNECTEGSYLLPDTQNRYGFLESIREVFGPRAGA
jgi:hypothetical protein